MGFINWAVKATARLLLRSTYARGLDVARWRSFMNLLGALSPVPRGVSVEAVDLDGLPAFWFRPKVPTDRVALYLHGGMYVGGSVHTYRGLIGHLCRATGLNVLAPDYRLAPEHPFPAAVEDARKAFAWLRARRGPPLVMGDSAGGGLALALLASLDGHERPPAGVLLSPWVDLTLAGRSMAERNARDPILNAKALRIGASLYLGEASATHRDASPLFADLSTLPPLQIHVGSEEVLYDDSVRLAERARDQGVSVDLHSWAGMIHGFQGLPWFLREAGESLREIGAFCRERG